MKNHFSGALITVSLLISFGCSPDEDSSSEVPVTVDSVETSSDSNSNDSSSGSNSNDSSSSSDQTAPANSINPINPDYECGNGFYYLSRPEPTSTDSTHRYYEYPWQSDPSICVRVYDASVLSGREVKVNAAMDWVKVNLPNIIPVNVFYIDQFNASSAAKLQHDTDFCYLVDSGGNISECVAMASESWGDRSYGGGVYGSYLHNGADLMIYDDAFTHDEGEDAGIRYLVHEYFHTFQTSHLYYFEDKQQFGIRINDELEGISLPFLPIWFGEGGADFASVAMMAKQNLDFDHYERAVAFLDEARTALTGADASFSLEDFESENTRVNDEYYAYGGGFMAHAYLWHLDPENFKKLIIDYYTIFAEKYKLNPQDGWKDAFEETFGMTVQSFYNDFDAFMRQDRESQVAIIKSLEEWENASWN